jgi:FlaA1/EpsC-like NDP-sugar epimerase
VQVNVGGTRALLEAAVAAGVPRFVLVSTDKAVKPSSVMGATKRVAEALVGATAARSGFSYVSVRFGNVLGSAGSVVPIFQHQLEHGEPLTVTDPDMTRYFMTIPEAAWLILDAASIGDPGDNFVLDMGQPVRILDLARDLVRLSGRAPDSVPIQITGLRPGEKLHEQLFYDAESIMGTDIPKVLRALDEPPPDDLDRAVDDLLATASGDRDHVLRTELFALVERLGGHSAEITGPVAVGPGPEQSGRPKVTEGRLDVAAIARIEREEPEAEAASA